MESHYLPWNDNLFPLITTLFIGLVVFPFFFLRMDDVLKDWRKLTWIGEEGEKVKLKNSHF